MGFFKEFRLIFAIFAVFQTLPAQAGNGTAEPPPKGDCFQEIQNPALTKIAVPCLSPTQMAGSRLDLQACNTVLSQTNPLGVYQPFYQLFKNKVNCYYGGFMSLNTSNTCSDGSSTGTPKPVVCSINDGEDSKNHLGESCGSPESMDGTWESAQARGLWIQAMKFFRNQVWQNEILGSSSLTIHPACQPMAQDYVNLNATASCLSSNLTANIPQLPPQIYSGDINFCSPEVPSIKVNMTMPDGSTKSVDLSSVVPKMSACFLGGSRQNRVGLFTNIAQCEVWTRMDDFFVRFAAQESKEFNKIVSECAEKAMDYGSEVGHRTLSRANGEAAGKDYFKKCYTPRIKEYYKNIVNQVIPGRFESKLERSYDHLC